MCNGQAQRDISLHEYVITHLCGYVATVPAQHFGIIERALLTSVLDRNINVALTAMDVWCFLARYSIRSLDVILGSFIHFFCQIKAYNMFFIYKISKFLF